MEIVDLTQYWELPLVDFLKEIHLGGEERFFSPHGSDLPEIRFIVTHRKNDIYRVMVDDGRILAYGMLRGWNDGFEVPSLGMAVSPNQRGLGLGRLMITFLHAVASKKGANRVRLRVHNENYVAKNLYASVGYEFEPDAKHADFSIGFRKLGDAL